MPFHKPYPHGRLLAFAAALGLSLAASLGLSLQASAQAPDVTIDWKHSAVNVSDNLWRIDFDGELVNGWHTYSLRDNLSPTVVEIGSAEGCTVKGVAYERKEPVAQDGELVFFGQVPLAIDVELAGGPDGPGASGGTVRGSITWRACNDQFCASPETWDFEVNIGSGSTSGYGSGSGSGSASGDGSGSASVGTPIPDPLSGDGDSSGKSSIWALIIEAILWGFAMLLTPCVFPMVPMTLSFFMKGSPTPAAGRFKAFMYGLFIVLLYTLPICLIIGLTLLLGGETVTADIFNWLATHWLPNLLFFVVFMVFAASFFGAFEITLPSSLVNKSDSKSDKGGLAGVFFMALTLVLVSFSCTGPIVGSVLIKSTQGEFWAPMVTMLAFSVAFALPFTILALFPSLLKKLKSGSWLNSVKVVLGFIEIALGLKFLSVPDQTYHWGLLDREVYLAIWIVDFSLLGFYLLGKIRFKNDDPVEHIGVVRLSLVIAVFSFVVYMIPGMFGAPLKALSGYLPPISTQDFILGAEGSGPSGTVSYSPGADACGNGLSGPGAVSYSPGGTVAYPSGRTVSLPHGLQGYLTLDEGFAEAGRTGKPIFVDITGHGCTNCREMEARVWSDPGVLELLRQYVMVALYTDDKTRLDESAWVTTNGGKVLKDMGRVNSYIARERFGVNAQPNYALLSPDGALLAPVRGYNLNIEAFKDFLRSGLED